MKATHRESRERGSALVITMVFVLAILALVVLVAQGVDSTMRSQRLSSKTRSLQLVLQSGIADAVNELRTGVDADGDGLGAVGTNLPGGLGDGVEVRVDGRLLGRYRATVDDSDPARVVLTVVAAYPDFDDPEHVMAAQTVVEQGSTLNLFDHNSLVLNIPEEGVKDPKKKTFKIDDGATVSITDPTDLVPAVNVTNQDFLDEFLSAFDDSKPNITLEGQGGSGADTVVNAGASFLSEENLKELATSVSDFVDNATIDVVVPGKKGNHIEAKNFPDPSVLQNLGGDGQVVTFGDEHGDGKGKKLKIDGLAVSGSGTLVITRELELKKGATIDWDGDVVIYSDDKKKAKLKMHGGELNVTGNVILVANPEKKSKVDLHFHGKKDQENQIHVDGSFLALSVGDGDKGDVKLKIHEGGKKVDDNEPHFVVNGLFAVLGTKIDFEVKGKKDDKEEDDDDHDGVDDDDVDDTEIDGTLFQVTGSTVFAVAVNDGKKKSDAIKKFKLKKDVSFIATYDKGLLNDALDGLNAFFTLLPNPPELSWDSAGYVEVSGRTALEAQTAAIAAAQAAGETLGVEE